MYTDILKHIDEEISSLSKQIQELSEKRREREEARDAIRLLQAEEDAKAGKLATQKEICPFPEKCSRAKFCTYDRCNADTCSNGYAYRMS
jgi:uncharacterized protein YydD (DUF2326 family)